MKKANKFQMMYSYGAVGRRDRDWISVHKVNVHTLISLCGRDCSDYFKIECEGGEEVTCLRCRSVEAKAELAAAKNQQGGE